MFVSKTSLGNMATVSKSQMNHSVAEATDKVLGASEGRGGVSQRKLQGGRVWLSARNSFQARASLGQGWKHYLGKVVSSPSWEV